MKNKYFTLLALGLGDGTIATRKPKETSKIAYLDIAHHNKHEDYIKWKANIISELGYACKIGDKNRSGKLPLKKVFTKGLEILQRIRKRLYKENKKVFRKNWIKSLKAFHLAILWMDDGCFIHQSQKTRQGNPYVYHCGEIATQSFDLASNKNIVEWLKTFGIDSYIIDNKKRNFYYIRMNRDNVFKLIDVVKPYVSQVESMKYKIERR